MDIEKISKYLLYGLFGVSALIFICFFIFGFGNEYEADPTKNNPALTDVVIVWSLILAVVAFVGMIVAYIMYIRQHGVEKSLFYTWGLPIVTLIIGAVIGFANRHDTLLINGHQWNTPEDSPEPFKHAGEIIISDASIISVIILAIIAIAAIIWSLVKRK